VAAVNSDGTFDRWDYRIADKVSDVAEILRSAAKPLATIGG